MRIRWILAACLLCLSCLAFGKLALGSTPVTDIPWSVIGSGGHVAAGIYQLDAAAGQPVSGIATCGSITLCSGFWCRPAAIAQPTPRVYLPLVLRAEQ